MVRVREFVTSSRCQQCWRLGVANLVFLIVATPCVIVGKLREAGNHRHRATLS
jgi:hypothetical protein